MVAKERFQLALQLIEGTQWRKFETLCTVLLAEEYPSLRPMASPSGDGGLDAILFVAADEETTVLQFSVRKDWAAKIRETCARVRETTPSATVLIFASNQVIGPDAAPVKKEMRSKHALFVDIRDREWFLTHRNRSTAVEVEAEEFCRSIADPFLADRGAIERQARALEDLEAKAAFVYLGLQWQDDTREKGLTKLCFEAIVRAVLRDTTSEKRLPRGEIKHLVAKLLPAHDQNQLHTQVDSALARLSKVYIRHWTKQDEFCLTWEERQRLHQRLALMESMDDVLRSQLALLLSRVAEESGSPLSGSALEGAVERARSVLERVLLERGEAFAGSVVNDRGPDLSLEDVEALVYSDFAAAPKGAKVDPRVLSSALMSLLVEPPEEVRPYLRSLADTYTLFAFLRETPDVQSAVVKIFSEGDIWLDASVVLPLFAEDLLSMETQRSHGLLLGAAREAGLRLYVTPGVVEELATHINRCRGYHNALARGDARGPEPFLLSSYRLSGRVMAAFDSWLDTFAGTNRAEDDVADYLEEFFGIVEQSLDEYAAQADPTLRAMVAEIWHEARDAREEKRAKYGASPMDFTTRAKLVSHDVESYVGIQMRRASRNEKRSAFGYKSWWLTLDGTAFKVKQKLSDRLEGRPMDSPALSPDFMLNYLAVGPVRMRLSKKTEEALPLMLNMSILDAVPKELVDLSDELRRELAGLPHHVVRRKIRDALDDARLLLGARAAAGEEGLTEEIRRHLIEQAKSR